MYHKPKIIYAAIGDYYVQLAKRSIDSLHAIEDAHVNIFTCHPNDSDYYKFTDSRIVEINLYDLFKDERKSTDEEDLNHIISRQLKLIAAINTPFDKFLFLDSDTIIKSSISDFFSFSKPNTIYLTNQALLEYDRTNPNQAIPTGIISVSEIESYNSGVFGVYKSDGVLDFLSEWLSVLRIRQKDDSIPSKWMRYSDQEALHVALQLRSYNCRFQVISNEVWNATDTIWKYLVSNYKCDQIKVLHSKLLEKQDSFNESIVDMPSMPF
jgi:hypothetical protein